MREAGADGMRERPLIEAVPDLEWVPPEVRFFQDWQQTSAGSQRVFAHWVLDIHDYSVVEGEREIGFIPRPLRQPKERLLATREGLYMPCWSGVT